MPTDDQRPSARIKAGSAPTRGWPPSPWRFGIAAALAVVALALVARNAGRNLAPLSPASTQVTPVVTRERVPTVVPKAPSSPDTPWIQSLIGSVGWAIAENNPHILLTTVTGGRSWTMAQTLSDPVLQVDFVTKTDGYLTALGCASSCSVLEDTTDGGATWTVIARSRQEEWTSLDFTSATVGYISGNLGALGDPGTPVLWYTTDGGHNLTALPDPCTGPDFGQSVSVRANRGLLVCAGEPSAGQESKQIYSTQDGGRNWTLVTATAQSPSGTGPGVPFSGYVGRMASLSGATAFMALNRSGVEETTDGGRSWTAIPTLPVASDLATVGFSSSEDGWVEVSQGGQVDIYVTADGGKTWSLRYPANPPVSGLAAIGNTFYGLVPVQGGTEVWSYGASGDWVELARFPSGPGPVNPLGMTGSPSSWVVYGQERLHLSPNAGRTWTASQPLPGFVVSASFGTRAAGWYVDAASSGKNLLLRTTDGGERWTPVATPFSPATVVAEAGLTAWVSSQGSQGAQPPYLWRTVDGGTTWQRLWRLPGDDLVGGFAPNQDGLMAAGRDVWTTTNGGAAWTLNTLPEPSTVSGVEAATINAAGEMWLLLPDPATGQSMLWASTTGGQSWKVLGRV